MCFFLLHYLCRGILINSKSTQVRVKERVVGITRKITGRGYIIAYLAMGGASAYHIMGSRANVADKVQ